MFGLSTKYLKAFQLLIAADITVQKNPPKNRTRIMDIDPHDKKSSSTTADFP